MLHLNKFIDRVQAQDSRGSRDLVMTISDARALHADITRLLAELHDLRTQVKTSNNEPAIEVRIGGGTF